MISLVDSGKKITSRGVPASETLYLPAYNSPELRSFQDSNENITRNLWDLDEIVNFVFSKKYQPTYHKIARSFLFLLTQKVRIHGEEIAPFIKENSISKATFYNRVLPRLRRVGMIKVERETLLSLEGKKRYRPMIISLSKTFGNYLIKLGDSWLAAVADARTRKKE